MVFGWPFEPALHLVLNMQNGDANHIILIPLHMAMTLIWLQVD
jgi:hypothetical protein